MKALRVRRPRMRRVAPAGLAASAAYVLAQELDRRLVPNGYDDLMLWGGFLSRNRARQRLIGAVVHGTIGVAVAAVYDAVQPALPRWPGVIRGILFVQAENAVLYPGVPLLNRIHPAVRNGELPSLLTWRYFGIELTRHAAFGAVMGVVLRDRDE